MTYREYIYKNLKTRLNFANMASVALYKYELEGQISDGLYENRMPYDHWRWICGVVPSLSKDKLGYETDTWMKHSVRYSLRSLISHIGKNDDWDWTERILQCGKMGSLIPENKLDIFWKECDSLGHWAEKISPEKNTVEKLFSTAEGWERCYMDCTLLTDELIQKFLESTYSLKDLKRDAELLSKTVNNYLGVDPELCK